MRKTVLAMAVLGQLLSLAGCFQAPGTAAQDSASADDPENRGEVATENTAMPAPVSTDESSPAAGAADLERVADLATSGDPRGIATLSQAAVEHPNPVVRREAVVGLAEHGHAGMPALVRALRDPDPTVRSETVESLADIGGDAARAALESALQDPDLSVRGAAKDALEDLEAHDPQGQ